MLAKYDGGGSKEAYKIDTGDESWLGAYEPETKQQSTMLVFEPEPNPSKVVCEKSTSYQMVAWFFCKTVHVATVPLSGTPQFVCPMPSEKFEKRTREDETLFTMAMRSLTHLFKSAPYWLVKTLNWWVIRRTALTWHPMTSFYSPTSRKKCVVNDLRHQKVLLEC